jgi:hypothetical protein
MRGALATLAAVLLLLGTASGASGSTPKHGAIAGMVPHVGYAAPAPLALSNSTVHASPSLTFDANYETLINRYFTDVAAASVAHAVDNVYSTDTQYFSNPGHVNIQYDSTFGGSFVSHDQLPANGCDDGVDAFCLTDQQLQAEIQNVLTTKGWHGTPTNMFFLMTPDGVGSCTDSSGTVCSSNFFCAYHSDFVDASSEDVIYANEPYEGTIGGCANPFDQGFPNDVDADTTINTISHEHNEAITDPFGTAWFADDGNGDENGDLCAFGFGTQLGGTPGVDSWNQVINGHKYELQEEFSNADVPPATGSCVNHAGGTRDPEMFGSGPLVYHGGHVMHTNTTYAIYWLPTPGNTTQPVITGTAAVNHTLTSSVGSWTASPTAFAYQWQRCSSAGTACVNISGATASTYTLTSADGANTVRSTVRATNVNGTSTAVSPTTAAVVPVPAATGIPVVSGLAGVGRSFSATTGTWNTAAAFAYQWMRCAANGSSCAAIPAATASTYPLIAADARHTLKIIVTATNAAGATSATSAASALVVAVPRATGAPRISGKAAVGKRLRGTRGTWSGPPESYKYAWLRCNARGAKCVPIKRATHPTYRLTNHDAGHRLRLRVTATNAAGSKTATSAPSKRVGR